MKERRVINLTIRAGLGVAAAGMIAMAAPALATATSTQAVTAATGAGGGCAETTTNGSPSGTVHDPARNADDGCVPTGTGPGGNGYNGDDPQS